MVDGDYVYLKTLPETPSQKVPPSADCKGYEYMTMVQLCNIAEEHGFGRSKACNAFGGDDGKYHVLSVRKARVFDNRKYVLVSAVIDYFNEFGIVW